MSFVFVEGKECCILTVQREWAVCIVLSIHKAVYIETTQNNNIGIMW